MKIPRVSERERGREKENRCNWNVSEPLKGNSLIKIRKYEKMKTDWKETINFSTDAHALKPEWSEEQHLKR